MGRAGPGLGITQVTMFGSNGQWIDMPAAETELFGVTCRVRWHLEGYTQVCFNGEVLGPGSGSAVIRAHYTIDTTGAGGWAVLVASSGDLAISAIGVKQTTWQNLPAAAKDRDVLFRVMGQSGDGAADPALGRIWIGLR